MGDTDKTREQLINELTNLRRRLADLEALETERQQAIEALHKSEATVRALLESASNGIVIVKTDGRMLLANASAVQMFGYCREELLGQPIEILLPERFRQVHRGHWADYCDHPRSRPMGIGLDLAGRHKDGSEFPVEIGLSFIETEDGILIMSFITDITKRKQAEEALQQTLEALRQQTEELQARNAELNAFAHTVAHDLKAPLALIVGFAEALTDVYATVPEKALRRHLNTIVRHGRKMSNIIDELLLLATVRTTEIEVSPLDMATIVAEAQARLARLIEEHQAEIIVPKSWPVAQGYAPWVEEVWANYLSNAIKYGGLPPRVELGATAQANGTVRFWVRDNGPGLTLEDQARLFTPFPQLYQIRAQGHGLGLSIVRRIVEKLNGEVGVESQVGQGSVFSFTLPALTN